MDQALKARLIGAVILVGLAVLVIPELLSGRKSAQPTPAAVSPATAETSPTSRTITIELGAQDDGQHANSALDAATQKPAPAPVKPARANESQQPGAYKRPVGQIEGSGSFFFEHAPQLLFRIGGCVEVEGRNF